MEFELYFVLHCSHNYYNIVHIQHGDFNAMLNLTGVLHHAVTCA